MALRGATLVGLTSVLVLGSLAMPSATTGSILSAASPAAPAAELHFAQVRAEYIDLSGNRDETETTLFFVNKSLTKTIYMGDVSALGPDGLAEVLGIHKGLNGRWKDTLTAKESAEYEKRAEAEVGAECARWLASGEGID